MRCFSSSVVPLQPPQPCVSCMRYGVVESTASSNRYYHIRSHHQWPRTHVWQCHCASRSSLPRIFHISIAHLSSYIAAHHTIGIAICNLQKYMQYFSLQVEHRNCFCKRHSSSRHHATQATKPPSHHTRCSTAPADIMPCLSPLSHQRCEGLSRALS
jgi:hypothetical protein